MILRGTRGDAIVGGSEDSHAFSLGENGEPIEGRRLISQGKPHRGGVGGRREWRAVAFETLETIPNIDG
jgi:hypothetical protein